MLKQLTHFQIKNQNKRAWTSERGCVAATCEGGEASTTTSVTGRSDEDSRNIEDEHEDQPEFGIKLMR